MLIDTHCHLHDREFFSAEQAEKMLVRAHENGVKKIVCIGTSHEDSLAARDFAEAHNDVYWTYGIHPEHASGVLSDVSNSGSRRSLPSPWAAGANPRLASLRTLLRSDISTTPSSKLVAIGEVGLDYHYEGYDRDAQIKLFREMLELARDNDLPVSFHVREAFDDFFEIVKDFPEVRGVVHSFTDSKKVLKRILNETDYFVGVNGLATYSTLPTPPLERIVLETDAPFLTPVPFRGIINECAYIRNIAEWLSEKLGEDFSTIERETTKNAERLYRI
ncbi:TatD family hydrolase [Candidatus Saccharibacteria bacterium]|nr:TatD family hydrolase [Candidatus Saccharibacteria bacterium]